MKNCIIFVDCQKGFIGLNTKHILPLIDNLLNANIFDYVIASKFINGSNSPYRKILNWHSLSTDDETNLYDPIEKKSDMIIDKEIYTVVSSQLLDFINKNGVQKVFICGIDTDCCVLKTAVDLFEKNIHPIVLEYYSASNGGVESHNAAIKVLERLIGKKNIIHGAVDKNRINMLLDDNINN